jgi:hypothetical protein
VASAAEWFIFLLISIGRFAWEARCTNLNFGTVSSLSLKTETKGTCGGVMLIDYSKQCGRQFPSALLC